MKQLPSSNAAERPFSAFQNTIEAAGRVRRSPCGSELIFGMAAELSYIVPLVTPMTSRRDLVRVLLALLHAGLVTGYEDRTKAITWSQPWHG